MAITIHDVARQAGVSVKTVSRAINDHPDVSAATRETVLLAARSLGYRPNPIARGLRIGTTGLIALLVPDILDPHYAEFMRHMQSMAAASGQMAVLAGYNDDPAVALAHLRSFIAHRVDGLVWMTPVLAEEAVEVLVGAQLPTVIIGLDVPAELAHIRAPQTAADCLTYEGATFAAVEHLVGLGHRRLVYIAESPEHPSVQERIAGFRRGASAHDLAGEAALVWTHPDLQRSKLEGGYLAALDLFAAGHRPTAICTSSDTVATGVLRALHERSLDVPGDISLVGCNDTWQASYAAPPLTTIHTPYAAQSAAAFDLLLHVIDPSKGPPPVCTEGYSLVVRGSSGPAPSSN